MNIGISKSSSPHADRQTDITNSKYINIFVSSVEETDPLISELYSHANVVVLGKYSYIFEITG